MDCNAYKTEMKNTVYNIPVINQMNIKAYFEIFVKYHISLQSS